MQSGICRRKFVVAADVFPNADQISDVDVNRELLATFSP
jgi:hypothetical protein